MTRNKLLALCAPLMPVKFAIPIIEPKTCATSAFLAALKMGDD